MFPPLASSSYLKDDKLKAIDAILKGLTGEIKVNGKTYNGVMPAVNLTDSEIASVVTYILNTWGNNMGELTISEVMQYKSKIGDQ